MRKVIIYLLFFAVCDSAWAQLKCTNCTFYTNKGNWTRGGRNDRMEGGDRWWSTDGDNMNRSTEGIFQFTADNNSRTVLGAPGTVSYNIDLRGNTDLTITGTGQYIHDARMTCSSLSNHSCSLTLSAPNAGGWGGENAGIILTGDKGWYIWSERWKESWSWRSVAELIWVSKGHDESQNVGGDNEYTGVTTIKSGYIICNKPAGVKAIAGDIIMDASPSAEGGLWFNQNDQLSRSCVLTLKRSDSPQGNSLVRINGTSQTLAGINATKQTSYIENFDTHPPPPNISRNTGTGRLTLTGNERYIIGNGAVFRGGNGGSGLEVQVQGNGQVISNPNRDINNVSFVTSGTLELFADAGIYTLVKTAAFSGGGTHLKTGAGELMVFNFRPTGNVEVREGILNLQADGNEKGSNLGNGNPYTSTLTIAGGGVLDHANAETLELNGRIEGSGILRRTPLGNGKMIITGDKKAFSGTVLVAGGFLGGTSDVSNAFASVETGGNIGGGSVTGGQRDKLRGGTFTVGDLSFQRKTSRLSVTALSDNDGTPSLLVVKARTTDNPGTVTALEGFTVDITSPNISNGYILKCRNGTSLALPVLGANATGKAVYFRWDNVGLYMFTRGLICDNCTFTTGGATVTGTKTSPAPILGNPDTFAGDITLKGDCNFIILGTGNYILSGRITGTGPLTFKNPDANADGLDAGITLSGRTSNNYTGPVAIRDGYLICNKSQDAGAVAVPNNILISGQGKPTHVWCVSNGQFGGRRTVVSFGGATDKSYLHVNGTVQTVAGIQSDTPAAVIDNRDAALFPVGTTAQLGTADAVLNIIGGAIAYVFGGGGAIRKGPTTLPSALTVNVTTSCVQIIQDPSDKINNVTLTSAQGAVLEFRNSPMPIPIPTPPPSNVCFLGEGVVFKGDGDINKRGNGTIGINKSSVLKSETTGKFWIAEGTFRNNGSDNVYANNTAFNGAILDLSPPIGSNNNPVFDLWGNNSVFDGLVGVGTVQSSVWCASGDPQAGAGYALLTLGHGGSRSAPVFQGVIRDNPNSAIVAGGAAGGIALKKIGTGTQGLMGANLYTGPTLVSAGRLKFQGNMQLGTASAGNVYGGNLEISNAPEGVSAIFEYKGDLTQIFNGNITNNIGAGALGTFLQSGTGSSIITGTDIKDFRGNVNITAGFFGGTADLRNTLNVNVRTNGRIGGGAGTPSKGGTLTVSGLNFAANSTLTVTARSAADPAPSLVIVKRQGTSEPGAISIDNNFNVEILDTNISDGYILKCNNGLTDHFPLPVITVNNTGKKVRLIWDDQGLKMHLVVEEIILTVTPVCPKGMSPGNPAVTVDATYIHPANRPPQGSPVRFWLSDEKAKIGEIEISWVGDNIIRGVFSGANLTQGTLPFSIFYDDKTYESLSVLSSINPQPSLKLTSGSNAVCLGTSVNLQAAGNGQVTISAQDDAAASIWTMPDLSATATLAAVGNINLLATDGNGCKSEYLTVIVRPNPAISPKEGTDLTKLCSGSDYELLTTGTTPDPADKWLITDAGNNSIGTAAVTANGKNILTPGALDSDNAALQDINFQSGGCMSNTLHITINPKPLAIMGDVGLCSGVSQPDIAPGTGAGLRAATGYKWLQSGPNADETGLANSVDWTPNIPAFTAPVTTNDLTRNMLITPYNSQSACVGDGVNWSITVHPAALISTGAADVSKLCAGNSIPITQNLSQGAWKINDAGQLTNSIGTGIIIGADPTPTLLPGNVTGAPVVQEISFKSGNCTSNIITITVNPSPTLSLKDTDAAKLCSGGSYELLTSGTTAPVSQWLVKDKDADGNSIGSAATTGADGKNTFTAGIVNSDNATLQEISFQSGVCKSLPLVITVNPKPLVKMPFDNLSICAGNAQAEITPGTGAGLRSATGGYKWQQSGPNADDTGLANSADWTPGIPAFTAPATTNVLTRSMIITPYNAQTSCTGEDVNWKVTVQPEAIISAVGNVDFSKLCSGTAIPITQNLSQGEWLINDVNDQSKNSIGTGVLTGTGAALSLLPGNVTNTDAVIQEIRFKSGTCISNTIIITVRPSPTLTLKDGVDVTKLCSGGVYNGVLLAGNPAVTDPGTWSINDDENNAIGSGVTMNANGKYDLTTGTVNSDNAVVQSIRFQLGDCKSPPVLVTVNPKPLASVANINLCSGDKQSAITPGTGISSGLRAATGYKWQQSGDAFDDVGLANSSDWTPNIPDFTAPAATRILTRSMVITPYNSVTSCVGVPQPWSITVSPIPNISPAMDLSRLCASSLYNNAFTISVPVPGKWAVYNAGTSETSAILSSAYNSDPAGKGNIRTGNPANITAEDVVFISDAASCSSNTLGITILPVLLGDANGELPTLAYCDNQSAPAWTPPSAGIGVTKPTAIKWEIQGTNSYDIGLEDYRSDWTKTAISGFTAKNTSENMIFRGLKVSAYNEITGCTVDKKMTINVYPNPIIRVSDDQMDLTKLCAGTPYLDVVTLTRGEASGEWQVLDAGTDRNSRINSSIAANNMNNDKKGSLTAGNALRKTDEEVVYKHAKVNGGCVSNKLPISVYPKPVMDTIPDMAYCVNSNILSFTPKSKGKDETKPTNYQWKLATNAANSDNVGLTDYYADWTKTEVSGFQSAAGVSKRDIRLTGYNAVSGCTSKSQNVTISLDTKLTLTPEFSSPICSGTKTNILLKSSLSNTSYSWIVTPPNGAGAASQALPIEAPTIEQVLTAGGNASETVKYTVTGTSGNDCQGTAEISIDVSPQRGVNPEVSGGGSYCVNPDNNEYQTNLIPSAEGASEWTYTSSNGDGNISGNTQQQTKSALSAVNDHLVLFGNESSVVSYVFRAFNGCLGPASAPVEVKLFGAPEAQDVMINAASSVCSNSATHHFAANIALNSSASDVSYTWTADTKDAPDVTNYSEPSTEGAVVSVSNPPAAKLTISDPLSLPVTAAAPQVLKYAITPWRLGCPGRAVLTQVQVNPLPVVTPPANRQHCSGTEAPPYPLTGTNGANLFKWSGGGGAGLPDQADYGAGLPGYTAPTATEAISPLQVIISAKNDNDCESEPAYFSISVSPKPSITLTNSRSLCSGATLETAAATNIGVTANFPGAKYTWRAASQDNKTDGSSDVKIIQNGVAATFPLIENTPQEGSLIRKITASEGSDVLITFYVKPVIMGCQGDAASSEVRVRGSTLQGDIVNNAPTICNGSPVNIKAGTDGDGLAYSWTSKDNVGNLQTLGTAQTSDKATVISDVLTLKDNQQGNVTYTVTPSNSDCTGAPVSHSISVAPGALLTALPATANICSGAETDIHLSLSADPNAPKDDAVLYAWQVSDNTLGASPSAGNQPVFEQQKLTNPSPTEASVTYTFTAFYNVGTGGTTCKSQAATVVYSVSSPTAGAVSIIGSVPEKICVGDEIILTASPSGLAYQWLKDGEPVGTGNTFLVPTDRESVSSYTVQVTNSCGNGGTSAPITANVSGDAYFAGASVAVDKSETDTGLSVNFSYTGPEAEYRWDFGDQTTANTKNPSHNFLKSEVVNPVLKVVKPGQPECSKTFAFPNLKIKEEDNLDFAVYPIPTSDRLTITCDSEMRSITIGDISGRLIMSEAVSGRRAVLSISCLAQGVYILTVAASPQVRRVIICKE